MTKKPSTSKYIIDIEDGGETARLIAQDAFVTRSMGGVFPPHYTPEPGSHILDIACGPGGWVLDVAFAFPDIQVVGVDINEVMVEYARARAQVHQVANVRFEVMDISQRLDFDDHSFDLVNARFLVGVFSPENWSSFLHECYRVLRPGGHIRLTETENPLSTSVAMQEMSRLIAAAFLKARRSFSADGFHLGILPVLPRLLEEGGFLLAEKEAGILDGSAHSEVFDLTRHDVLLAYKLIQPFVLRQGIASQAELDRLYETIVQDLEDPQFSSISYWLSVWGKKPDADKR